jgi:hypothetical protein
LSPYPADRNVLLVIGVRVLAAGTHTPCWRETAGTDYKHELYVREDTVFKPFGD